MSGEKKSKKSKESSARFTLHPLPRGLQGYRPSPSIARGVPDHLSAPTCCRAQVYEGSNDDGFPHGPTSIPSCLRAREEAPIPLAFTDSAGAMHMTNQLTLSNLQHAFKDPSQALFLPPSLALLKYPPSLTVFS